METPTAQAEQKTSPKIPRPVPPEFWGRNHWNLLAYVETRCVDYKGIVTCLHMRVHIDRHKDLIKNEAPIFTERAEKRLPTMLKDGVELSNHDDYDCIDDLIAAGLIKPLGRDVQFTVFSMTEQGWKAAHLLRQHRAALQEFETFTFEFEDANSSAG